MSLFTEDDQVLLMPSGGDGITNTAVDDHIMYKFDGTNVRGYSSIARRTGYQVVWDPSTSGPDRYPDQIAAFLMFNSGGGDATLSFSMEYWLQYFQFFFAFNSIPASGWIFLSANISFLTEEISDVTTKTMSDMDTVSQTTADSLFEGVGARDDGGGIVETYLSSWGAPGDSITPFILKEQLSECYGAIIKLYLGTNSVTSNISNVDSADLVVNLNGSAKSQGNVYTGPLS